LRSGTPKSVRDYVIMYHETVFELFNELPECVRSGQSAFELTHGKSNFEHLDANPAARKVYAAGLANQTRLDNAAILESYDFGNAGIVADIGGGSGALLFAILEKHQNLEGILFERDSVVELVRSTHNQDTERHSLVAGDFFKAVPVQADVLVLKQVLHDWQDDECVKILQNCRSAVEKKGKLLIVERLIGAANATILTPILDVTMLAATGGRERREDEYAALFTRAGFALRRVIPTGLEMNILEAAPV
jgi:hypothetical protein